MSLIIFDNRILGSELAVSRTENAGGGRKQQQTQADLPETVGRTLKTIAAPPAEAPKAEAASALPRQTSGPARSLPGDSADNTQGGNLPPPGPLVLLELQLNSAERNPAEGKPSGQARLDIRI